MARQIRTSLDMIFGALADPTRRAILARLALGDAYVTELAEPHDMSLAAVSRHLHVLSDTGMTSLYKEGRSVRCRLNAEPLKAASEWVRFYRKFWEQKLDSLGGFLDGLDEQK